MMTPLGVLHQEGLLQQVTGCVNPAALCIFKAPASAVSFLLVFVFLQQVLCKVKLFPNKMTNTLYTSHAKRLMWTQPDSHISAQGFIMSVVAQWYTYMYIYPTISLGRSLQFFIVFIVLIFVHFFSLPFNSYKVRNHRLQCPVSAAKQGFEVGSTHPGFSDCFFCTELVCGDVSSIFIYVNGSDPEKFRILFKV